MLCKPANRRGQASRGPFKSGRGRARREVTATATAPGTGTAPVPMEREALSKGQPVAAAPRVLGRGTAAAHLLAPAPLRDAWRAVGQAPPHPRGSSQSTWLHAAPATPKIGYETRVKRAPHPGHRKKPRNHPPAPHLTAPPAAAFKSAPPSGRACAARRSSRESSSPLPHHRRGRWSP